MSEKVLRNELYAAFENRAMMYHHIFCALRDELGEEKATRVMKRGIYRRGLEIGRKFHRYSPQDMSGLRKAFLEGVPDGGHMFQPAVLHCDNSRLDIQLNRCPLKDAWEEAGLKDKEIARLCDIAAAVDHGTFEGAGFSFTAKTWKPGQEGCCLLKIRPGQKE